MIFSFYVLVHIIVTESNFGRVRFFMNDNTIPNVPHVAVDVAQALDPNGKSQLAAVVFHRPMSW
jgi:hypothetical protein